MVQQTEKDLRINQLKLISILFLVVFVFMLVYTIYFMIDYNKHYGFFIKTNAEVIEHKEIDNKIYDVLSFEIDNNVYKVTTDYVSKNDVGDVVTIYYDETNPLGIVYSLDNRRIVLPILTTSFGVLSIGLFVVYLLIYRSNKINKKS